MKKLTMRERRNLLCYYLQAINSGVANYSISDWAVNHLLLELIQIAHQERSLSDVVNSAAQDDLKFSLSIDAIERELEQEKVFA